jgi:hypothetical protein
MTASYTVPREIMDDIYETLKFYANECSYQGERTGGVLAGCPRAPAPTPEDLTLYARLSLAKIDRHVLGRAGLETGPVPGPMPSFQEFDCHKCATGRHVMYMILCPTCGNKRCPKASDHELACTNSNATGQPGSIY